MEYKRYFVKTWSTGEGVYINTDPRWTIRIDNIYYNPLTDFVLIEYLSSVTNRTEYSKATTDGFNNIEIKEIHDHK